jgi:MoCo/4Fe-4S cofactor protein with predicted Tat translocation signal
MSKPRYWKGIEELEQTTEFIKQANKEFPTDISIEDALAKTKDEDLNLSSNRRDFLKMLGFGVTAATLAACEAPIKKAIPYLVKPADVIPGVANYYSSTCGTTGVPIVVKTREGRPIKVDGNPDSKLTRGGLTALGQAVLLDLYDSERLEGPKKGTNGTYWEAMDTAVGTQLADIAAAGGQIRLVSRSVTGPAAQSVIAGFLAQFGENARQVVYDTQSVSAIARAHEINFGKKAVPSYHMHKAEVIAAFNADFLGTWLSPETFSWQYAENRAPEKKKMSRHFQVESLMTLTGSNADLRFPVNPAQEGAALLVLHNKIAQRMGKPSLSGVPQYEVAMNGLEKIAAELVNAKGKSLVISGSNNIALQQVVNAINFMLGNYGTTVDLDNPMNHRQGDDAALEAFVGELERGAIDAVLFYDTNPVYETAYGEAIAAAMSKVKLSVAFTSKANETSSVCAWTAATPHYLESWGDASVVARSYSLTQPTINPLFDTRQPEDTLLRWSGNPTPYADYLETYWKENFYPQQSKYADADIFWTETVRSGLLELDAAPATEVLYDNSQLQSAAGQLAQQFNAVGEGFELMFYEKVGIRDGRHANNPWLQELPDPVTKTTWDNYITLPVSYIKEKGWKLGQKVKVSVAGQELFTLPIVEQPGQAQKTFGVALGYGRTEAGKVAALVGGANAFKSVEMKDGALSYSLGNAALELVAGETKIARTQTFHTLNDPRLEPYWTDDFGARAHHIIKETTLENFIANPAAGNEEREEMKKHLVSLWDSYWEDPKSKRYIRWAMAIDMNKCTGCGACVISCHAENNVPVVGKSEILNRREMHWMRIDRYYSGDENNPDVAFQPMLCQHCDNAPCETVCPVLATIHSHEGLNQMTYNRCVGTRYCANNCPYKVRRFNWFNYATDDDFKTVNPAMSQLGSLVLNPDVTVRFRGVMEKCSFCVQRLQEGKLKAKIRAGGDAFAKPEDGEIKTACQTACPTGAIVFGDLNDPNSEVAKLFRRERSYHVIEEVKTLPSISYQTLVRNRTADEVPHDDHAHAGAHA